MKRTLTILLVLCWSVSTMSSLLAQGQASQVAAPDDLASQLNAQRKAAKTAEQDSLRIAVELRQRLSVDPSTTRDDLAESARLREAVEKAFRERQRLHELELMQLKQRTERMEKTLQRRGRIAQDIVLQRIDDLLNPNLSWNVDLPKDPSAASALSARASLDATGLPPADNNQVTITAETKDALNRAEEIQKALTKAAPNEMGNVQIQLVEGALVIRGAKGDVQRVQNVISEIAFDSVNPAHSMLDAARHFLQLAREGRIPEAAALSADAALATQFARIPRLDDLVIEEAVATRRGDGFAISQPMIVDKPWPQQYVFQCLRAGGQKDAKLRIIEIRPHSVSQVVQQIDNYLSKNPDAKVVRVGADREVHKPQVRMKFRNAPWKDAIAWIGEQMGAELQVAPTGKLKGDFSYQSAELMTAQKAFRIIQGQLRSTCGVMLSVKSRDGEDSRPLEPVRLSSGFPAGVVTKVENGSVEVSLGSADGVGLQTEFYVVRDETFVAKLGLRRVDERSTGCLLSVETPHAEVNVGDQVLRVDPQHRPDVLKPLTAKPRR